MNDNNKVSNYQLLGKVENFIERIKADPKFLQHAQANPKMLADEFGFVVPEGMKVEFVQNTDQVIHFIMPVDSNNELSDEVLMNLNAAKGGSASSAGSVGTAGSFYCFSSSPSCVGTASTVGSAGSAGSGGTAS